MTINKVAIKSIGCRRVTGNSEGVPEGETTTNTGVMMERIREASPRLKARIAGVLYLIIIVAASFAEFFVRGRLVVGGDAGATATNILAHEPLYLGLVTVGVTERKSVLLCIFSNPRALTIELILLTLSGYPEVLRGWDVGHTVLLPVPTDCSPKWKYLVAAELPSALPKCRHRQGFISEPRSLAPA